MNSILTKCFSCCGRQTENSNNVFNIKDTPKISNSSLNLYAKLKSKGSTTVNNLKKTNFKDENTPKKYSFIISPSSSDEDISKQKNKSENSIIIKKKITKKKVTYKNDIINDKDTSRNKKNSILRNSSLKNKNKNKNNVPFFTKTSLIPMNDSSNTLDDLSDYCNNSFISKHTKQILSDNSSYNNNIIIIDNKGNMNKNNININNESFEEDEIDLIPKLILSDLNGDLFKGKIIKIDAKGCLNGLRRKRDMKTYFGINNNKNIINDVILNIDKDNLKEKQIFLIYYDKIRTHYYISNLMKENKFLYIKIYYEFILKNKQLYYFVFGKIISLITLKENDDINITIYNKNSLNTEYTFHIENSPIIIGREKCLIEINNNSISRIHCTIFYHENKGKWYLNDGNGKGKHSTHGTWLIINENEFEINSSYDKYEIKLFSSSFSITILDN